MSTRFIVIPGTGIKLVDGNMIALADQPGIKWVLHWGLYTYQETSYVGWYTRSVLGDTILPIEPDMLVGAVVLSTKSNDTLPPYPADYHPIPLDRVPAFYSQKSRMELDKAFITVRSIEERDMLLCGCIPDGKIIRVNDVDGEIKYYTWSSETKEWVDFNIITSDSLPEYTIVEQDVPEPGYLATYQLLENDEPIGAKINIPLTTVVSSGSVVLITYNDGRLYDDDVDVTELIKGAGGTATESDAGEYIKLILATVPATSLYINANNLIDVYTVEPNATQVQLAIDANREISAFIVSGSVGTTAISDEAVTTAKLDDNAVTSAKLSDDSVTATKVNIPAHTETQAAGADGLALSVTTTHGQVTGVSGSIAANTYDPYGAADAAVATWTVLS